MNVNGCGSRRRRYRHQRMNFVFRFRKILRGACLAGSIGLALAAAATPAQAQAKLEARYTASLAGLPIGEGTWTIDLGADHYKSAATGTTTGLMRAFTGGHGTTVAQGTLQAGKLLSAAYAATIATAHKTDEIRFTVANGTIKDLSLDPPQDKDPERVPITDADQKGVLDPMTSTLVRMPGTGDLLTPEACQRSVAVFDGRLRYDLKMAYKRMETVKADKGYAGPVVVCAVFFSPVAGYIPSRTAIKYLTRERDIEVWLAPIAGTRVLVPFRAQAPTPIGRALLEAREFVTVPMPTRASAGGVKTQ